MQHIPRRTVTSAETATRQWVVLDTNVVLDWLVFRDSRVQAMASALADRRLQAVATSAMREELGFMLASNRLARWTPNAEAALGAFDESVEVLPDVPPSAELTLRRPRCSDPDDQVFIDLALALRTPWLLTHDRALLRLARRLRPFGVAVSTPMAWADASGNAP